jgi:putative endonuclease
MANHTTIFGKYSTFMWQVQLLNLFGRFAILTAGGAGAMEEKTLEWYVYILRCGDGSLYTGSTDNVARRLAAHRAGKGAKYTRGRGPLELVYTEKLPDKSSALRREWAIKHLSRQEKLALIEKHLS